MVDLTDWLCPACGHRWKHRDEQSSCPKCHAGIGKDYPVPELNRLTCSHWIWAKSGSGAGAQCGARVAISVGQTLGFCIPHSKGIVGLAVPTQQMLGVRHLA